MRKLIIKEGPLVFLRNVLTMEVIAALFLYAMSFLQNYEEIYRHWGLTKLLRYDLFLIIAFSAFQLVYVSLLFLDWYFSHYEITEKEITKKSGLLFRHKKSTNFSNVVSTETYNSPLGRWMKHATIILHHQDERKTKIKNISNAEEYAHILKQMVQNSSGKLATQKAQYFIDEGEGRFIEFKETLRWDARKNEVSKEMERMVLKTIVAFLNADGGTLLIGVNDIGEILGLERDFKTLPKKNRDGFENHLSMLVKTMIGLPFSKYIHIKFEKINPHTNFSIVKNNGGVEDDDKVGVRVNGLEVCLVFVGESHKPAYLKFDQKEDFFVRVGNSTQPFSMSETQEHIKTKWS